MINPANLVSELWFSDPTTHVFSTVRSIRKPLDSRTFGVYGRRLDAANQKIRYSAEALLRLVQILDRLKHGEFIYFTDHDRLVAQAALESFLVFLRASLDLVTAAWWAYHTNQTNIDSFHDLLKKLKTDLPWAPLDAARVQTYFGRVVADYESEDFSWLSALVGQTKGQSLRDIAVHRSILELSTAIDDKDRGFFVLTLKKETVGDATAWLTMIYECSLRFILHIRDDIEQCERALT